ncbi:MAG: beta-ketoacyl synthase [Gammaproteobacteria bacterium]|nr:beta-ketoacyl synthase [Gammaproteobacteria bacterium]MYF29812.1 beta-ketoacyl synthase [Gammaproteobacteria bacterium]MYK46347.1 beta-ketoacyl synthase [Gammaproteobacteria bacterium]
MSSPVPVIVGFGGINPAGRVSFGHAYRRTVIDVLGKDAADDTYASLAGLMNVDGDPTDESVRHHILDNTLIRRIDCFDPDSIGWQRSARLAPTASGPVSFVVSKRDLPDELPPGWSVRRREDGRMEVTTERLDVLLPDRRASKVTSAGQAPSGFQPDKLYPSRNHPRGLQLNVFGASDAVQSVGIPWDRFRKHVRPDEFAAYSGSAMGQLDSCSNGGMMQAPMMGRRPTAKQAALGLPEMPVDFVNAYVIGSVGQTAGVIGACATFLYNLKAAVDEIRAGRCRVAVVGGAEAPIIPEVVEAYRTMGALAEDDALMALDGANIVDNRRACRPFGPNCGFTLAEAAVYVVVTDDALAIELGADIHAAVADVFVNADGYKKSIPGPGIGNYVTVAKALACARAILGEDALRHRSYVHAHGTGTPQNRVTESRILNEMAKTFGIDRWTVAAVKAYVGHTLAPASGDQTSSALGTWRYGWIPGIATIDRPADDVQDSNLRIAPGHVEIDPDALDIAFVNSKGFGGNNATGVLLSPAVARRMLTARHGAQAMRGHAQRNDAVHQKALDYDAAATRGDGETIYQYGLGVLDGEDLRLSSNEIVVPGYDHPISLAISNPYSG